MPMTDSTPILSMVGHNTATLTSIERNAVIFYVRRDLQLTAPLYPIEFQQKIETVAET